MYKPTRIHIGGRTIGMDVLLTLLVGFGAAAALILSSGQPVKWLIFAMTGIFVFTATLIIPDRERFFLYCTLFFCPYASISISSIPKASG
ncbi:MAG: hypothetical protein ACOZF0_04230 [Thermodesulfobacteriota bacterium]